jgi:hypothetical protein
VIGRTARALLLIAVGVALGLFAIRWWGPGHDRPAGPAERPAARPPPVPTAASGSLAPPASTVAPPVAPAGLVRAAIARRLRGAELPRELVDLLAAGDIARAAVRLAASKGPGSAALEWDLLALCHEATESAPAADAEDELAAHAAVALRPDLAAVLQPMIEARHAFGVRLGAGCRDSRLDPAALQHRLAVSAASGDAASLERLTAVDGAPQARLQSAALLGSSLAQFRLALTLLADRPGGTARTAEQRQAGLSWLQAAAKGDADAQSYYGGCLLEDCPGAPDPLAARAALESAARRGSSQALGLLSGSGGGEPANNWSGTEDVIAPLPPRYLDSLGLDAADHYAWAVLAARLARDGCFGFAFLTTAQALAAPARLEPALRPAELAEARERSTKLWSETGVATRHALSCD